MYNAVEGYYRPTEIIDKMETPYVEMSKEEHGFICGLIRDHSPKRCWRLALQAAEPQLLS